MTSARVTQQSVEVVTSNNASARVTQQSVEVVTSNNPSARVTQQSVEVVTQGGEIRVYQAFAQVLRSTKQWVGRYVGSGGVVLGGGYKTYNEFLWRGPLGGVSLGGAAHIDEETAMGAFIETRLPVGVRMGTTWVDEFSVDVVTTASGNEYRRLVHPFPRRRFSVRYTDQIGDLWDEVLNLYVRVYGRYAGFRVRAIDDWSTNEETLPPTALDQVLAPIVAGTTYQLRKEYGSGDTIIRGLPERTIHKPVINTVLISVDDVPTASGWSVNSTTGVVTFSPPIDPGATVKGGCEFDIPCRFDSDLALASKTSDFRETSDIDLVELLNP